MVTPSSVHTILRGVASVRPVDAPDLGLDALLVGIDTTDWERLDELESDAGSVYGWMLSAEATLSTGERRRAWCSGSHDEANLVDNLPQLEIVAPRGTLPETVSIGLRLWFGWERAGAVELGAELRVGSEGELDERAWDAGLGVFEGHIVEGATEVRRVAPMTDDFALACLLEVGIVTELRDHSGYRLHTTGGAIELRALAAHLAALPGRSSYERPTWVAGPNGLLAVHALRSLGYGRDAYERYETHLVVASLPDQRLLLQRAGVATSVGRFDASGAAYVCRIEGREVTIDLASGAVRPFDERESPRPFCDPAHRSHGDGAFHSEARVAAWLAKNSAGAFPSASVLVLDPTRGLTQHALPDAGGPLAVLRDGRVLVMGDRLWELDAARGRLVDRGPFAHTPEPLLVEDRAHETVVWTLDPARWRIRWCRPESTR